jgi:hypothetical protein
MSLSCNCCVFSSTGLFNRPITRLGESDEFGMSEGYRGTSLRKPRYTREVEELEKNI